MSDERIAALEAHRQGDQVVLQDVKDKLDEVASDVQEIKMGLQKQKGFIAGVLFVLVPIWGAIVAGALAAWEWWKSQ